MATRYHIKPDGTSGVCTAQYGRCPFGKHTPHGSQAFVDAMHERQEAARGRYMRRGMSKGSSKRRGPQSDLNNLNSGTMAETFGNLNVLFGDPVVKGDFDSRKIDFVRYEMYDSDGEECTMDIYRDGTIITRYDPSLGKDETIREYDPADLRRLVDHTSAELHQTYINNKSYQPAQENLQMALKRDLGLKAVWNKGAQRFELEDFPDQDEFRERNKNSPFGRTTSFDPQDPDVMDKVNKELATLTGMRMAKERSKAKMDEISGEIKEKLGMTGVLRSSAKGKNIIMGSLGEDGQERLVTCTNDSWVGGNPSILGASKSSAFDVLVDPPAGMSKEDVQRVIKQANGLTSVKARRRLFEENGFQFSNEAMPANPVYGESLDTIGGRYGDPDVRSAMTSLAVAAASGRGINKRNKPGLTDAQWRTAMQVYAVAGSENFQASAPYDPNGSMADMHSIVTIDEIGLYRNDVRHTMAPLDHEGYVDELESTVRITPGVSYYPKGPAGGEISSLDCELVGDRVVFPVCMQGSLHEPDPGHHKKEPQGSGVSGKSGSTSSPSKPSKKDASDRPRIILLRNGRFLKANDSPEFQSAYAEWQEKGMVCPDCDSHLDKAGYCAHCTRFHSEKKLLQDALNEGKSFKIFSFIRKSDSKQD